MGYLALSFLREWFVTQEASFQSGTQYLILAIGLPFYPSSIHHFYQPVSLMQ